MTMQHANTAYKETIYWPLLRPGVAPSLVYGNVLWKAICEKTIYLTLPRPSIVPSLAHNNVICKNNLQRNLFAPTKTMHYARPDVWQFSMQKQFSRKHSICLHQGHALHQAQRMAMHYGMTSSRETFPQAT